MATEYQNDNEELTENAVNEFKQAQRRESARALKGRISRSILSGIEEFEREKQFKLEHDYLEL